MTGRQHDRTTSEPAHAIRSRPGAVRMVTKATDPAVRGYVRTLWAHLLVDKRPALPGAAAAVISFGTVVLFVATLEDRAGESLGEQSAFLVFAGALSGVAFLLVGGLVLVGWLGIGRVLPVMTGHSVMWTAEHADATAYMVAVRSPFGWRAQSLIVRPAGLSPLLPLIVGRAMVTWADEHDVTLRCTAVTGRHALAYMRLGFEPQRTGRTIRDTDGRVQLWRPPR